MPARRARARRSTMRPHEWVIDGQKTFITNSGTPITKCVTITARTGPNEISNIVVDAGTPGFDGDAAVPEDGLARVRHARAGVRPTAASPRTACSANAARASRRSCGSSTTAAIAIAALAVGLAQACLDASVAHARTRNGVRRPDRPLPVDRVQVRRHGRRGRERAQPHLQGGVAARTGACRSGGRPRWRSSTRARSR